MILINPVVRRSAIRTARRHNSSSSEEVHEDWPKEIPMTGDQKVKWMEATGFNRKSFLKGVYQAYSIMGHVIKNGDGDCERWDNIPIDDGVINKWKTLHSKTDERNNALLAQRIATPSDTLLGIHIKELTLKDDDLFAKVTLIVSPDPEVLFGNDLPPAVSLFESVKTEDPKVLASKFLDIFYEVSIYKTKQQPDIENRLPGLSEQVISTWDSFKDNHNPQEPISVSWMLYFSLWYVKRLPAPRRCKDWVFRRNSNGEWFLHDVKIQNSRYIGSAVSS